MCPCRKSWPERATGNSSKSSLIDPPRRVGTGRGTADRPTAGGLPSRADMTGRCARTLLPPPAEDRALDKLAQHQPRLLAILDMVLADEGRQEVVEPKQDRDLSWPKAGTRGAVVCPLTVSAWSGGQLGRPNRGIPWRGWGARGDGLLVQCQLLYGGAEQLVLALFLWKFLNDFAVLDDGPQIVHRAHVVGFPQRADGEAYLGGDQTYNENQQPRDGADE